MDAVVVASNRGPLSFRLREDGSPVAASVGGGLAGTLAPLLQGSGSTWVFATMGEADRRAAEAGLMALEGLELRPVELSEDDYRAAYDVVANATLWFCFHQLFDLPRRPRYDGRWWEAFDAYRRYNERFAEVLAEAAPPEGVVLVQDYHLLLTGRYLAARRPDLRTVHFLHTPFCGPDALRVLPTEVAGEVLSGMAGFGSCGFHSPRWEASYRACLADEELAQAAGVGGPGHTFVAPLGPVPEALAEQAAAPACREARQVLRRRFGDRRLIVRVDRVELSKNIVRGCYAVEELLVRHPEWRGRFVLLALAYASREGLADYLAYRSEIEQTVARVNEAFKDDGWEPIVLDVADDRHRSAAALCEYDVLLVNPVRDGLNLVAKEGPLLNERHGTLVLSREAGAFEELKAEALAVNPFDVTETAEALHRALGMGEAERRRRAEGLRRHVEARPAARWLDDLLEVAGALPTRP